MEKHEWLLKELRRELDEGKYPVESRFPSEYDLANRFELAKTTANKVVSQLASEGYLSRGKRGAGTRVLRRSVFKREQIAYIGNINRYTTFMIRGMIDTALGHGYQSVVMSPPQAELERYLRQLECTPVKMVITCQMGTLKLPPEIPVIYIDQEFSSSEKDKHCVNSDNFQGGHKLMQTLLAAGHREILIYSCGQAFSTRRSRIYGFQEAMRQAGIHDGKERTFFGLIDNIADTKRTLQKMLAQFPGTSAIVTESDDDTLSVIRAAKELGRSCPGDIVLTGFGNIRGFYDIYDLLTADQHPYHMGALATNCAIEFFEKGIPGEPVREIVPVEICNANSLVRKN